ncbi:MULTISPECIES: DUF2184 domain-containing protein [Inquilinus]|uniref:DUF2184 domain-containing protein n=1 Tax=Inquilinus ginsengisoli TaxID=363840 RepID=A0ABU1JNW4_9PROT|nr:major capsid family protein [Inquilinus ginsengisoli]MDR6290003.1 hypothetical protein [Inquilinus ginsengisoli]
MFAFDAQQALGFLVAQTSQIEAQAYEIQYPDIQYPSLVPVDTSANPWAKSVTFFSTDKLGQAAWHNALAKDVPLADVERNRSEQPVELAAIGYRYTTEELGQAMMIPGLNLSADRAAAAVRAYEEFMDGVALRGVPPSGVSKGWTGLINDANVFAGNVANDGAGASTLWSAKTPDQILRDINGLLGGVYTGSLTVEMADTLLLPVTQFDYIATTARTATSDVTILEHLRRNNTYTAITGAPLTIRAVRGLETAGAGSSARMVGYRRDPQVVKLHLPMPHRFQAPWQSGALAFDVPGIFRTGGVEIRRPKAFRYGDGI